MINIYFVFRAENIQIYIGNRSECYKDDNGKLSLQKEPLESWNYADFKTQK